MRNCIPCASADSAVCGENCRLKTAAPFQRQFLIILLVSVFLPFLCSVCGCTTTPRHADSFSSPADSTLTLLFAGDIMAHKQNFTMRGYDKIWADIAGTVSSADFSFANIEAPVSENLPWSAYPNFCMKPDYPAAAIGAGFNVFSLVNNHTNDQGLPGMKDTSAWAETVHDESKNGEHGRTVYFSGLKQNPEDDYSWCIIQKDGWTVLFLAVTEILNRPDYTSYMNYVPNTRNGRSEFISYIQKLRLENPCDIFVLSLHSDEEEYIKPVLEERRDYYHTLLENGVDIIWANHPHIIRERELIGDMQSGNLKKLILYGNGNTISGQRREPQLDNPANKRDFTGDGLLFEVTFSKNPGTKKSIIKKTKPYYITTYINTDGEFIIRNLDSDFAEYLKNEGRNKWASYIQKRIEICGETEETTVWQ